jgi:hypothetical protein
MDDGSDKHIFNTLCTICISFLFNWIWIQFKLLAMSLNILIQMELYLCKINSFKKLIHCHWYCATTWSPSLILVANCDFSNLIILFHSYSLGINRNDMKFANHIGHCTSFFQILYINCLVCASVCRGPEMSRTWRWNISGQVRLISGPRFCHKANVVSVCVFVTDICGLRPRQWDERALCPSVRPSIHLPSFLPFFLC